MKSLKKLRLSLAIRYPSLRKYLLSESENERLIMLEFRSIAQLFGFDINNMSDQEIKDGVKKASLEMSKAGVTGARAGLALRNAFIASKISNTNS